LFFVDIHYVGRAANRIQHHFLVGLFFILLIALITQNVEQSWLLRRFLATKIAQLVLTLRRLELVVHIEEGSSQPFLDVLLLLEALHKDVFVVLIAIDRHLPAAMAIKYSKKCLVVIAIELCVCYVCILLFTPKNG
jgi:hypothetical protein